MNVYLNTFIPLAVNKFGRKNANAHNLPPFIDGSCRREPDFQNPFPAISQLCRPKKLVPRLSIGDYVIYITKQGRYGKPSVHWNFIAILEVVDFAQDHKQAEAYYLNNKLPISQNIICNQTSPFSLNKTHGWCGFNPDNLTPEKIIVQWNEVYVERAKANEKTAITKVWQNHLYLHNPPMITHQKMKEVFGRIPGTQNPPKLKIDEWMKFENLILNKL
tara:strand:+ start:8560 stop:9213 length:654 start_codon:yes stop_codon:yes gene_type:complete